MRPIPADLAAHERDKSLAPRHAATVRRGFMRRIADNYRPSLNADLDIPQMYANTGSTVYATWRTPGGQCWFNISGAGGLDTTNATLIDDGAAPAAMRCGMGRGGSDSALYVYRAVSATGAWRLQRAAVSGTTAPIALAWANFGPAFSYGGADTAEYVRRVEAIIPLADGHVLVADGAHQFTAGASYIRFYLVDQWNALGLRNVIEMPLTETRSTWRGIAKHCTYIAAASCAAGIVIAANADPDGHAVTWTLQNGVESAVAPVVPVDVLADNAHILPCAISTINDVLYLTAHITRYTGDASGTTLRTQYDAYLTASPTRPALWSFGGLGHYITPNRRNGTMLLMPGTAASSTIIYVGNGSLALFETTPEQYPAPALDLAGRVGDWTLTQIADGADELRITLLNGDGALNDDPRVSEDAILTLQSGHAGGGLIALGEYSIRVQRTITKAGWGNLAITGRDIGHAKLVDCSLPFSGMMRGRSSWRSDLKTEAGLTRKTPDRAWGIAEGGGLTHDGLNDPFIAYLDAYAGDDFLTEFTVRADCNDEFHRGNVGVVFGAVDSADGKSASGNILVIPKTSAWTGHTMTRPRLRKFKLGANGWDTEERMAPLVEAAGETTAITEDAGAAYPVDAEYAIPAGVDTEIAVRLFGEFIYVFAKRRDDAPDGCAANAKYTLVTRARFSRITRRLHGKRPACGIALSNDVFASKTAFAGAFFKDIELQLTDAQIAHGSRAGAYSTPITGTVTGYNEGGGSHANDVTGNGTKFQDELRVGQSVMMNGRVRVIAVIGSQTGLQMTDSLNCGGTFQMFMRSGDGYAWASSAKAEKVAGDTVLHINPRAQRNALEVGMQARISSDDNTARSDRFVLSDGVNHILMNSGWDTTCPIPAGSPGYGGSEPSAWRIVGRSALIARKPASAYGLPNGVARSRYMMCGDEVVRYVETSFTAWAEKLSSTSFAITETWLHVPTKFYLPNEQYGPLAAIAPDAGDPFGATRTGDLVELTTRNNGDNGYFSAEEDKTTTQLYAFGKTGTSLALAKYDAPFGGLSATTYEGDLNPRDMVITSGRGAFGTPKQSHKPDAPVAYYPVGDDGKPAALTLKRIGFWSGCFITLEDAIAQFCGLAAMRNPAFRSAGTLQTTLQAGTAQTISSRAQSDFALDVLTSITADAWLSVYLRDYYRLDISQPAPGVIGLRLIATQSVIAAHDGLRVLRAVDVPVSDFNLVGDVGLRVIAAGTEIIVECARQPVWTFDLEAIGYVNTDAAAVQISCSVARAVSARMVELCGEAGDTAFTSEQTVNSIISDGLLRDRNVSHRSTPDGGVEFSSFWDRDEVDALDRLILRDTTGGNSVTLAGHVQAIGDNASGEYVDDGVIAKYGWRTTTIRAGAVKTIAQAVNEARLYSRRLKEQYAARSLDGFGILEAQPEDRINLSYQPGEGRPQLSPTEFVITRKTLSATADALKGQWDVRGYYDA
ncbi:MAG: hypothetical protein WAU96_07440 [Anaerolineae bacterium]|nr:hypothetical protein [Thermoflexales bacterium]